jgi:hypothetical protein
MKSVLTQVMNHWFQKILNIRYVSTHERAFCNIMKRDCVNHYFISNKYLRINKARRDYQFL